MRETGDGRVMRIPAYFATCERQQGTRIRHRRPAKQPTAQGGPVEQARVEFQYRACDPVRLVHSSLPSAARLHVHSHPDFLANKHCLINVQNNDEKCFVWSVLSALYPPIHSVCQSIKITNTQSPGVDFPCPNKTNPPFQKNSTPPYP